MTPSTKKEDILDAAETLFYQKGFHATGINEILKESGVASMTLYRHFTSKEDLVQKVLLHREKKYWSFLNATIAQSPEHPFITVVQAHGRWLVEKGNRGCMLLRAIEEFSGLESPIEKIARDHKKNLVHFLEDLARKNRAPDPERLAAELALVLEGVTAMAQVLGADEVTKRAASIVKEISDRSCGKERGQ
ncbi:TetR/AcrR family transcriptional regulator [Paenibacillus alkalitolerans]|uniref:TetR/AcrR family transcriptional regulator n=1 Tax=Paenibacillus alkalitolerans TaxID=2799335 RepID=UPI0018F3FC61|nr:TetR/AcrR family transcriptional regulator [Paenibacillus alkalitolerans]